MYLGRHIHMDRYIYIYMNMYIYLKLLVSPAQCFFSIDLWVLFSPLQSRNSVYLNMCRVCLTEPAQNAQEGSRFGGHLPKCQEV